MGKTAKEIISARKEKVEALTAEMREQGYVLNDLSVDGKKANIMALLTGLLPSLGIILLFIILYGLDRLTHIQFDLLLITLLISIVVHEGIHGLFFGIFAKNHFNSVQFGIFWKSLNPYCYCADPLIRLHYMTALLMPGFILGCCVGAFGIIYANATVTAFSVLNFFSAGGDIYIALLIMRFTQREREEYYLDHPDKPGVLIMTKLTK